MGDANLKDLLELLHQELEKIEPVDEDTKERLQDILVDIQGVLRSTPGISSRHHVSLLESLNEFGSHFEEAHLGLTEIVGRIISLLSNIGI